MASTQLKTPSSPVEAFVAYAQQMLDPFTPEVARRTLEPRMIALLPILRALGVFDLFELRDRALRHWLRDELQQQFGAADSTNIV